MTPDEQVRRIHMLEGAVRFLGDEQERLKATLALTQGRLGRMLEQQNQLLAAIRGLSPTGESVAPVA